MTRFQKYRYKTQKFWMMGFYGFWKAIHFEFHGLNWGPFVFCENEKLEFFYSRYLGTWEINYRSPETSKNLEKLYCIEILLWILWDIFN